MSGRRVPPRALFAFLAFLTFLAEMLLLAACFPAEATGARRPAGLDPRGADTVATRPTDSAARKSVESWSREASLADLVWVLRRPARELGGNEPVLLDAALKRCPAQRPALRQRLAARLGEAATSRGSRRPAAPLEAVLRPAASVFRVGVLLPDSGDYADYAREIWVGLDAGLASVPTTTYRPELEFWATGDDDPTRAATALEWGTQRCGVLVGELLSVNTIAIATGARLLGLPLISPTATDESIGSIGPTIFQIGPSGWSRGERLARAMLGSPGLRVGLLSAGAIDRNAFALGFAATAESLGAVVAWRSTYPAGTSFREEVRALGARELDVLLWDGESREAEALVRELTKQKVSVRLCGSEGLAPERVHAEFRPLLEGVRYVADEWRLPAEQQAALDNAVQLKGGTKASPLHVRGWLTGRALAESVAGGALCPEELAAALATRCGPPPWLAPRRFLDVAHEGAELPLFVVERGKAVAQEH